MVWFGMQECEGVVSLQEEDQLWKGPGVLAELHSIACHKSVNNNVILEKNWVIYVTRIPKNQNKL